MKLRTFRCHRILREISDMKVASELETVLQVPVRVNYSSGEFFAVLHTQVELLAIRQDCYFIWVVVPAYAKLVREDMPWWRPMPRTRTWPTNM